MIPINLGRCRHQELAVDYVALSVKKKLKLSLLERRQQSGTHALTTILLIGLHRRKLTINRIKHYSLPYCFLLGDPCKIQFWIKPKVRLSMILSRQICFQTFHFSHLMVLPQLNFVKDMAKPHLTKKNWANNS